MQTKHGVYYVSIFYLLVMQVRIDPNCRPTMVLELGIDIGLQVHHSNSN